MGVEPTGLYGEMTFHAKNYDTNLLIQTQSKTQSDKELHNSTSKVGQSAQPGHWHFPLSGFVTKLI